MSRPGGLLWPLARLDATLAEVRPARRGWYWLLELLLAGVVGLVAVLAVFDEKPAFAGAVLLLAAGVLGYRVVIGPPDGPRPHSRFPLLGLAVFGIGLVGAVILGSVLTTVVVRGSAVVAGADPAVAERVADGPISLALWLAVLGATLWAWLVGPRSAPAAAADSATAGASDTDTDTDTRAAARRSLRLVGTGALLVAVLALAVTAGLHDVTVHQPATVGAPGTSHTVAGVSVAVTDVRVVETLQTPTNRTVTPETTDGVFLLVKYRMMNDRARPVQPPYYPSLTVVPAGNETPQDRRRIYLEDEGANDFVGGEHEQAIIDNETVPLYTDETSSIVGLFSGHVDNRSRTLAPGERRSRWVIFAVNRTSRLRAVELEVGHRTQQRWWGSLRQVAVVTWRLGNASAATVGLDNRTAMHRARTAEERYLQDRLETASCLDSWTTETGASPPSSQVLNRTADGVYVEVYHQYAWANDGRYADLFSRGVYRVTTANATRVAGDTVTPC